MKILFVILGVAANLLFFMYVSAEPPLVQTHNIEIVVECVDAAMEVINSLGGHNLNVDVRTIPGRGMEPFRLADVTRRVGASEYRQAQQILRLLGTVTFESESARNVEASINDLRISINSATGEFERISQMMAQSDNLQTLIALDNRLSQIAWHRDSLLGSLNLLLAESGTALLTISLAEEMGVFLPPPEPRFLERMAASFFGSLRFIRQTGEGFVVFIAYALIPAAILSLFALLVFAAIKRVLRKRENAESLADKNLSPHTDAKHD